MAFQRRRGIRWVLLTLLLGAVLAPEGVAAEGQDDSTEVVIAGMRDALDRLSTVDIRFCIVNADGQPDALNWAYMGTAGCQDVVALMGIPRQPGNALGDCAVTWGHYRQTEDRQRLDVTREIPSLVYLENRVYTVDPESALLYERRQASQPMNSGIVMTRDKYYRNRVVYPDPGILFSHFYQENELYRYIDMIDRDGVRVEQNDQGFVLRSTFAFVGDGTGRIMDCGPDQTYSMVCEVDLDREDFLPRSIEYGPASGYCSWRMEVEQYLEQNGARYPERGSLIFSGKGVVQNVMYFIVDRPTAQLNVPLSDELMTVQVEPGGLIYNEFLQASYPAE